MRLHLPARRRKKGDTAKLAAQLAPLEELDKNSAAKQLGISIDNSGFSAIVVDKDNLHVPKDILEETGEKTLLGMEPVVLVILGVMVLFISFITWQISLMPPE